MIDKKSEYRHVLSKFEEIEKLDTKPYMMDMFGKILPVLPGVHSPKHFSDVAWFVRHVPKLVRRRSLLEIGTGTGVIALFASFAGAKNILATDINPAAVRNARATFRLHGLRIPVRLGSTFGPIRSREKFDVIFWNHPFFHTLAKPKNMLQRGGFDYKYQSLRAFFEGAKSHLTPSGEVLLGTGASARVDLIKRIAKEYGYRCRLIKKGVIPSKSRKGVFMEVRIYSFVQS